MQANRPSPRARPRRVRAIAFLLLVLQGLIAASPFFEPRNEGDLPRIHMEEKDAPHVNLHNNDSCALCSARTVLATPPIPVAPLIDAGSQPIASVAAAGLQVSTDARLGNFSRAPPPHPA